MEGFLFNEQSTISGHQSICHTIRFGIGWNMCVHLFSVNLFLFFIFLNGSRGSFAQAALLKTCLFSRTAAEKPTLFLAPSTLQLSRLVVF